MVLIVAEQDALHSCYWCPHREADQQCWSVEWSQKSSCSATTSSKCFGHFGQIAVWQCHNCWCLWRMAQSSESWRTETTFDNCYEAFQKAVTDNHFLANLLHPKYKGKHLSEADEEAAWQLLLKLHLEQPEVIANLCAFTTGSVPFPATLLSSTCVDWMSHVVWWTGRVSNCKCKESPPLISTALKLLHLPSSSTAIERIFSNFGLVQSKVRNQLGLEKAAKLMTCYGQLHGNAELNWIGKWNEHWNGPELKWNEINRVLCQLWL